MGKILVVGSSNTDMVVKSNHLPKPGETILGRQFFMNPGGKGANQAVAASRLGGQVSFLTKIGIDVFGNQSLENFQNEGISTDLVFKDEIAPSGVALINVDADGENSICVVPGANDKISIEELNKAIVALKESDIVLTQLEIPIEIVEYLIELGAASNKKIILNPAPANSISDESLKKLFAITPNETEAELLTGIKVTDVESAKKAGQILHKKGVSNVIITLGAKGAYLYNDTHQKLIEGIKVNALDTTAAGDTFNGALAVALSHNLSLTEAILFSNKAAALSVTKMGAQQSIPQYNDLLSFNT